MHVHVYLYDTFFYSKNYEKINPFHHQLKNITFLLNALFPLKNRIKVHITLVLFILTSIQDAMCLFSWIFNNFGILGHILKETVFFFKNAWKKWNWKSWNKIPYVSPDKIPYCSKGPNSLRFYDTDVYNLFDLCTTDQ